MMPVNDQKGYRNKVISATHASRTTSNGVDSSLQTFPTAWRAEVNPGERATAWQRLEAQVRLTG